jgi:hypothetical protein
MSPIRHVLLWAAVLCCGGIGATACRPEEPRGRPTQAMPQIVLNDRRYEVEVSASVADLDARVRDALAELELDIALTIGSAAEGSHQYRAGNGERVVDIEIAVHAAGTSRISVSAVRVTPMRAADVVEDPSYAKLVLQRIVERG